MSLVAISEALGSLGEEIGQELARMLGYQFAGREIIDRAASQYGQAVTELRHVTEEKPGLWERLAHTSQRYLIFVEAVVFELAARGEVVLVGRGTTVLLRKVRHALRVRITAPEPTRIMRVQQRYGLTAEGATRLVSTSDREREARIRFLYHVDWNDLLLYDLVVNTERLTVGGAARLILEALLGEQFQPTPDSVKQLRDLSLTAQARAVLLKEPALRVPSVVATAMNGYLHVSGRVETEEDRQAVVARLRAIPDVKGVLNDIIVAPHQPVAF